VKETVGEKMGEGVVVGRRERVQAEPSRSLLHHSCRHLERRQSKSAWVFI